MKNLTYKSTLHSCYVAYIVQATIVNLAPILFAIFQDVYGLSLSLLSALVLVNFSFQLLIDLFAAKITDALKFRGTMIFALTLTIIGLVLLGTLPRVMTRSFLAIFIATFVYSVGGGLLEAVVSPLTDALPLGEKHGAMALLHSFYCWGQLGVVLLSTLFIKLCGGDKWYILPYIWAIIPLVNLIMFLFVPLVDPVSSEERTPVRKLFASPLFILAFLAMVFSGASEAIIAQWSSLFAEKGLGVSKFVGDLLGPCFFALLMALGRVFFGLFSNKINLEKLLKISSFSAIICYLLAALVPLQIISLLACGFTGLTVALLWPGTLSNTAEKFPLGGTMLFGLLAFAGDLGCTVGPALSGMIADAIVNSPDMQALAIDLGINVEGLGLRGGILISTVFPIALFVCQIISSKLSKKSQTIAD
ncbi:MAG: MFS transporter [Christensenellales bacterium]